MQPAQNHSLNEILQQQQNLVLNELCLHYPLPDLRLVEVGLLGIPLPFYVPMQVSSICVLHDDAEDEAAAGSWSREVLLVADDVHVAALADYPHFVHGLLPVRRVHYGTELLFFYDIMSTACL